MRDIDTVICARSSFDEIRKQFCEKGNLAFNDACTQEIPGGTCFLTITENPIFFFASSL
jgi:hypothetical protein